jgi:hypothetical protein
VAGRLERRRAKQELVRQHAEAPHVDARAVLAALDLVLVFLCLFLLLFLLGVRVFLRVGVEGVK